MYDQDYTSSPSNHVALQLAKTVPSWQPEYNLPPGPMGPQATYSGDFLSQPSPAQRNQSSYRSTTPPRWRVSPGSQRKSAPETQVTQENSQPRNRSKSPSRSRPPPGNQQRGAPETQGQPPQVSGFQKWLLEQGATQDTVTKLAAQGFTSRATLALMQKDDLDAIGIT